MDETLFEFAPAHVLMAATGLTILLAYWLPRFVARRTVTASALLMFLGLLAYGLIPGMPRALDPTTAPEIWESVSEIVVIVVLFATGLRIDKISGNRLWHPTIRLLAIAMPLTIATIALLGWGLAGMTVAGAILLGAALAPPAHGYRALRADTQHYGGRGSPPWSVNVLRQLEPLLLRRPRVIFFAGERYREFLVGPLRDRGITVEVPMKGLSIGRQLSWLTPTE